MQQMSLVVLLLVKVSLAQYGDVLVMNNSCLVVVHVRLGIVLPVTMAKMLEYTVMVRLQCSQLAYACSTKFY